MMFLFEGFIVVPLLGSGGGFVDSGFAYSKQQFGQFLCSAVDPV